MRVPTARGREVCFIIDSTTGYSNDHIPIHVHVRRGSGEAVFEVEGDVIPRESVGLKTKELLKAEDLAEQHKELIIQH